MLIPVAVPEPLVVVGGKSVPKHAITMALPTGLVINTDVEFAVMSDGVKLGELHLSKGSIDWRPAKAKKTEHSLGWEQFAKLMEAKYREGTTDKPGKHAKPDPGRSDGLTAHPPERALAGAQQRGSDAMSTGR